MKELTIEEKAKRFDEALENARYYHDAMEGDVCCVLEECFPQLKESEDEKIRKELIFYLQEEIPQCSIQEHADKMKEFITWLEKQGKNKFKDRYTFNSIPRLLEMVKPTDRAKAYCQKLVDSLLQEGYATDAKIVSNCLKQMNGEKVAMATMDEQKSADIQSIEKRAHEVFPDDDDENTPLYRQAFIDGAVDYIDCGCKNSIWSEDEKDFMYDTLSNLAEIKNRYGEGYGNVGKCIDWLKSLRP